MGANSHIEWCDHTFNPWTGCTEVSPGCAHCYARTRDKRHLYGPEEHWGKGVPRRRASEAYLKEPLKWDREASSFRQCPSCGLRAHMHEACICGTGRDTVAVRPRVFCASMGDWLDEEVPIEWLADLLQLIHATPHLDWLLLTKRPENFVDRLCKVFEFTGQDTAHFEQWMGAHLLVEGWISEQGALRIPANVWIGATVENQEMADRRIPQLLEIPARVRFLSVEPMLGPVDLVRAFELWDYCASCGASFDYQEDRADLCPQCKVPGCMSTGYGTAVRNEYDNLDGRMEVEDGSPIHWVICGGESGAGARPMHPDWARRLRDQCDAAGVPFFFKQWGEWEQLCFASGWDYEYEASFPKAVVWQEGKWVLAKEADLEALLDAEPDAPVMHRIGKHHTGRLLYDAEHSAFPEVILTRGNTEATEAERRNG